MGALHRLVVFCLIAVGPALASTGAAADRITGVVLDPEGAPVEHANVFVLETLDGALTDAGGRFDFETAAGGGAGGTVTLVVMGDGFREHRGALTLPLTEPIVVRLERAEVALAPIVVEVGRLATGADPRLDLSSIQVVTTPGAAADVYRALRTFPGLQQVDEGAGLFVRGGDVFETRVFLNDAVVLSPYRYESPTGGFFGAFDPFLLDGIFFSTGGFGARYGDALSGIAALSTRGRPERPGGGATVSLASISATASLPLPAGLGARATATRSNTELLFRVNGTTSEFTDPPEGRDLSGGVVWDYRPTGGVEIFGIDQRSRLGIVIEEPSYAGELDAAERHDLVVATWHDRFGGVRAGASVATAGAVGETRFGAFRIRTEERLRQARGHLGVDLRPWLALGLGGEVERRRSGFRGEVPADHYDEALGAPTLAIGSSITGTRHGIFAEADARATADLRLTAGLRTDRSSLARRRTWDPRLAAAYRLSRQATLLAAWGVYHQVPAPDLYGRAGDDGPPPMRAIHAVVGFQLGTGDAILRIEGYRKRYRDLAQQNRDGDTVAGGRGESVGVDAFVQWPERLGFGGRLGWGVLRATRTDPDTRTVARSPFDITHTLTLVVDRRHGDAWQLGVAARYATGRPFTPVVAASHDASRDVWVPVYGEAYGERLPAFGRVDLAASRLVPLGGNRLLVVFAAVTNAFDRVNVYDVAYSADYAERRFARSQFRRSAYFGATFTF